jgi:hypothetical protein
MVGTLESCRPVPGGVAVTAWKRLAALRLDGDVAAGRFVRPRIASGVNQVERRWCVSRRPISSRYAEFGHCRLTRRSRRAWRHNDNCFRMTHGDAGRDSVLIIRTIASFTGDGV